MKKASITPVLVFALLIAFASVAFAQMAKKGWEKTVTLPNGEVILDMSEEWDAQWDCTCYRHCQDHARRYNIHRCQADRKHVET